VRPTKSLLENEFAAVLLKRSEIVALLEGAFALQLEPTLHWAGVPDVPLPVHVA